MAISPNATVAIIDLAISKDHGRQDSHADAAFRKFEGLSLLEWSIRRLNESTLIDAVVVTGSPELESRVLACGLSGARWIPHTASSSLVRSKHIAKHSNAQWLVYVSPTCPFTDPALLDRLISSAWSHPDADYIGFIAPNCPRMSLAKLGLVGELCSRSAVERLSEMTLLDEISGVPKLVRNTADAGQIHLIPLPPALERDDLRFDLAMLPDWEHAHAYLEAVGEDISWQRLASLASASR